MVAYRPFQASGSSPDEEKQLAQVPNYPPVCRQDTALSTSHTPNSGHERGLRLRISARARLGLRALPSELLGNGGRASLRLRLRDYKTKY